MKRSYAEKLRDPRWQKRRLELLEKSGWQCEECNAKTETLHVHHGYYQRSTEPWEYADESMHVLCERCHSDVQGYLEEVHLGISGLGKFELFLMTELLSAIAPDSESPPKNREKILQVLSVIVLSASGTGSFPEHGTDSEWAIKAVLNMAVERAEQIGFENGQMAKAKGPL